MHVRYLFLLLFILFISRTQFMKHLHCVSFLLSILLKPESQTLNPIKSQIGSIMAKEIIVIWS